MTFEIQLTQAVTKLYPDITYFEYSKKDHKLTLNVDLYQQQGEIPDPAKDPVMKRIFYIPVPEGKVMPDVMDLLKQVINEEANTQVVDLPAQS